MERVLERESFRERKCEIWKKKGGERGSRERGARERESGERVLERESRERKF